MEALNKFNKSMIYTIRSPHTDKYYIGSTTQILCKRFVDHKTHYKRYLKGNVHLVTSFKIIELGDAYIELLEEINCENRNQLEKREGVLIREHKANCVNHYIPGRTDREYRLDNLEKTKQYYIDNADKIKEYRLDNLEKTKQYYIDNADKIKEQTKQYKLINADKIKDYYKNNLDKIKEQKKQHYAENKDKINEQRRAKRAEKKLLKDLESITI